MFDLPALEHSSEKIPTMITTNDGTICMKNIRVQGGALNRGLFFAGPLPSPLGAVSGKISKIR